MTSNLFKATWNSRDLHELRVLLALRLGNPGQYDDAIAHPNVIHVPLAGSECRISIRYRDRRIVEIKPGPAFDSDEWEQIVRDFEGDFLNGPLKTGRNFSFCSSRVKGAWRGQKSEVQVLPPPIEAPQSYAEHPFILEFPVQTSAHSPITYRRLFREHRRITLLLNLLCIDRMSADSTPNEHCWALVPEDNSRNSTKYVQLSYMESPGSFLLDELSSTDQPSLQVRETIEYYSRFNYTSDPLTVPDELDSYLFRYHLLSIDDRDRLNRAMYWLDMSSRLFHRSYSLAFSSLVTCIESLLVRGTHHNVYCELCDRNSQHEVPGPTRKFKEFLERFVPGRSDKKTRDNMYALRSDVLHGSSLLQADEGTRFGWDPPSWHEDNLTRDLHNLTQTSVRNWYLDEERELVTDGL